MAMIDIKNLDKLTDAQKQQFNALLEQFPHLDSKMETSRELNTPTKLENEKAFIQPNHRMDEELDYSNFMAVPVVPVTSSQPKPDMPTLKVNPNNNIFASLETATVDEKDLPENKDRNEQIRQKRIQAAINAGQEPEIASFNPEGKVHPILQKLRATVGMRSVQKPVIVNVGGCRYGLRPLDRLAISQATTLALTTTTNPTIYQANLEAAIIAYSIVEIDNAPIADVFSISKYEETTDGSQPTVPLTQLRRDEMAADALYMELLKSPTELVDALSTYYQQEFPPLDLMLAGKAKFMCPVGNCLQTRIGDLDEVYYCPIHGDRMAREDRLPNPL